MKVHFRTTLKALAISLPLLAAPTGAAALTVFDAANYRQNLSHYIDLLRNIAIEQGLMNDQLSTMFETLAVADEQLRQLILAARQLDNLTGYIEEADLEAIYYATQNLFRRISRMSPRDPGYSVAAAEAFNERYPMPPVLPPYEVLRGSPAATAGATAAYDALQRNRQALTDQVTNYSAAGAMTENRRGQIDMYRTELQDLGSLENPALATSQLATKQQNLQLLQNEEIIARLDREEERRLHEDAERLQFEHQMEAARMERLQRKARGISLTAGQGR